MDARNLEKNLFQESNSEVLNQFLHSCADEICGFPGPSYQQFADRMDWTEDDYNFAYVLLSSILKTPDSLYLDEEKMHQDYHDLPKRVRSEVTSCLRVRREQLTAALLRAHSKKRLPTMRDFDYRLKYTMGSSKLASLREPLLELDLTVEHGNNERIVTLEMNREELDSLINVLESINC